MLVYGKPFPPCSFCKLNIFTIFNPVARGSNSTVAKESWTGTLTPKGVCLIKIFHCPLSSPHLALFSNKRLWLSRQLEWGLWMRLILKMLAKHDLQLPNKQQGQTAVHGTWDFNAYQLLLSSPLCMRNAAGSALVIRGCLRITDP